MNIRDIRTIALSLHEARPGSYPNGALDSPDSWKAWNATVYTVQNGIAISTRNFGSIRKQFEQATETGKWDDAQG